ncbi:Ino eighty subunit 1 [Psilocybe cubensis]|uniref:Ino eighty subunit 1 n=2 Tax=Psilocybe cubensis TaxID=181762 RepID=A0ACB8HFQ4_PSICU|nr:Ino eighty subunit 1 [Psilocybe cubensis]KAH9486743.1 Ino eighty subunit 1 [Psilocybe cubensis]
MPSTFAMDSIPATRVGYLSRKALPIKRNDAEPLTREDVQYDLLEYLFTNSDAVFTDPLSPTGPKMTFGTLYASTVINSSKCSKVLKDKMIEAPAFKLEFAKIALLTNVGRINTTMAFFPEMKTALRTYHPVPSLQKTDGNAQDAPRIKNCLKAANLPSEIRPEDVPASPEDVLDKLRSGQRPSTSVVNMVFLLASHAAPLSSIHFDGNLNFLDLFLSSNRFASADRGRAFLWLLYHYIEDCEGTNPFDDLHSKANPGKIPSLRQLTASEQRRENVDLPEEIQWGLKMSNQRNVFLQKLVAANEGEKKARAIAPHFVTASGSNIPRTPRQLQDNPKDEAAFLFYVPSQDNQPPQRPQQIPIYAAGHRVTRSTNERTMFQHAWHLATSVDPLVDSDDEMIDHHNRVEYS